MSQKVEELHQLLDAIIVLIDNELYQSAKDWVDLLSKSSDPLVRDGFYREIPILLFLKFKLGESLFGLGKFEYSLNIFEELYVDLSSFYDSFPVIGRNLRDDVAFKISKCCVKIGGIELVKKAISYIESIPQNHLKLVENMILSKLYRQTKSINLSLRSAKEGLKKCPYAIELARNFIEMNPSPSEFLSIVSNVTNSYFISLSNYFSAYGLILQNQNYNAVQCIDQMDSLYPKSLPILSLRIQAYYNLELYHYIHRLLSSIHRNNPYIYDNMLYFAVSLGKLGGQDSKISSLSDHFIHLYQDDYIGYAIGAIYWFRQREGEKAIYLINKAIELNPDYWLLCYLKGEMTEKDYDISLKNYWNAFGLQQHLHIFYKIIKLYISQNQYENAIIVARECLNMYPTHPLARAYIASVLELEQQTGVEKAKKIYLKILTSDPHCRFALKSLARIEMSEGNYLEASQLYKQLLDDFLEDDVRLRYATALTNIISSDKKPQILAIQTLHCLLLENPKNVEAAELLERLKME